EEKTRDPLPIRENRRRAPRERQKTAAPTPPAVSAARKGYNAAFVEGLSVPLPKPVGRMRADVLPVEHSADGRLNYQHFSVVLSKSRRIAMFVAVNIHGKKSKKLERGHDVWALDGRVPIEAQIGEELYFDKRSRPRPSRAPRGPELGQPR